jgi:hypothetical protein
MKTYNCINYKLSKNETYFDVLLTDRNDTYDFLLLDNAGINQDIININLITDKGLIKDLQCMVYSRFANGYCFRVVPVEPFVISPESIIPNQS